MSGLILAIIVLVAAVWLIVRLASSIRWETVHVEYREQDDAATVTRRWLAEYTDWFAKGRYRLTAQSDTTLTFTRTYIPTFAILCAILLFPIGLIALVVRRDAQVLVNFRDDDGSVVTITGTAQKRAARSLRQIAEFAAPAVPSGV